MENECDFVSYLLYEIEFPKTNKGIVDSDVLTNNSPLMNSTYNFNLIV
jgi:hypothetical protein